MNQPPTAGTFTLDGMLQGPIPPDDHLRNAFEDWVKAAKSSGLGFHISFEGGNYSMVADSATQRTSRIKGKELDEFLTGGLNSLLKLLPPPVRTKSFSTIRSEEFRPGSVVQTLYTVAQDGSVKSEQRTKDADTEAAAPELTPASIRRAAVPAVIALLFVLLVSTFFIDYRKLFSSARDRLAPLKKEELVIDPTTMGDFITIELTKVDRKHSALIFSVKRGTQFERVITTRPADTPDLSWEDFSAMLAIHQGRMRVDFLNRENKILASREVDLRPLRSKETFEAPVVVNTDERIAKIVFHP